MTGNWAGTYIYGEGYPDDLVGKSTAFRMSLTETEGIIQGIATDMEKNVSEAAISGFIENNFLSFVKVYGRETDEHGDPLRPIPEIHYTGNFIGNAFEGTWAITWNDIDENGFGVEYTTHGTWQMSKA